MAENLQYLDVLGGPETYNHYPTGWTCAFNTPFKMWKRYNFEGGVADPSFAFSLGPVVWKMISEIFPNHVRGKAVAVSAAVNWGAAFVVSVTFLSLIDAIGEVATFLLFAVMCVIAFVRIKAKVPETKGKSLEEIQEAWAEHDEKQSAPKGPTLHVDLA